MQENVFKAKMEEYFEPAISISKLKENEIFFQKLDEKVEVAILRDGEEIFVWDNVCPHAGAPLNEGKYCRKSKSVQCLWHGYIFSSTSGNLIKNPNEEIFAVAINKFSSFVPSQKPTLKLRQFEFTIKGNQLYVKREFSSEI